MTGETFSTISGNRNPACPSELQLCRLLGDTSHSSNGQRNLTSAALAMVNPYRLDAGVFFF